jgi:hypothetical protein
MVDAVRAILRQCEESRTVKRVIHTASVAAASPLLEREVSASGVGYRDFIDESCWTSLNVDYPLRSAHFDVSASEASSDFSRLVILLTLSLYFLLSI